jgi:ABC-type branched-subunit amino acid transport system ATPase component
VAGLLSGGEQQMLELAPALVRPPKVFVADEPTLGLAPQAAAEVVRAIVELRDKGTAVLLVEENAENAVAVADRLEQLSALYLGGSQPASANARPSASYGRDHGGLLDATDGETPR